MVECIICKETIPTSFLLEVNSFPLSVCAGRRRWLAGVGGRWGSGAPGLVLVVTLGNNKIRESFPEYKPFP